MIDSDFCNSSHAIFPSMIRIKQSFPNHAISDLDRSINEELNRPGVRKEFPSGSNVALALGSRGINQIDRIALAVIRVMKQWGVNIFIVPAMGSHGGATASGQKEYLEHYGISEKTMGVPIRSSMEVIELGKVGAENVQVYFDKIASEADGIIVVNRIKPHTDFCGEIESGLMKMLAIGLGKHKGATALHSCGSKGLQQFIPEAARIILSQGPFILGLGIIEDAYKKCAEIKAVLPSELECNEKLMLKKAKEMMPSLPTSEIDLLVVDEMGKEISGSGLDTNIIGRYVIREISDPEKPNINKIVVLRLTEKSKGNAAGVGLSDIITRKLYKSIDFKVTYTNCITSNFFERAFIPVIADDDREAISLGIMASKGWNQDSARVVRIKSTLSLDELEVSENIWQEISHNKGITALRGPFKWAFSSEGNLIRNS